MQIGLSLHHNNIHLISDAFHSLLHVAAYAFTWIALLFAKKPANIRFTYGYTRLETISAFTNCIFLYFVTLFVEIRSIHNFFENGNDEKYEHKQWEHTTILIWIGKMIIAAFGIISFWKYKLFILETKN